MKIAVTIKISHQIGPDEWRVEAKTKVFDGTDTIIDITKWIKSIDVTITLSGALISDLYE